MADYNNLKASIANVIKTNNRNEITGQILQNVLNQMVGVIGENYQLAGFANPLTNPGAPDQNIFYIADQGGTYTNFDNIVLDGGVSFLMWKNSRWSSHTINVVTSEWVSQNFVSIEYFRSLFRAYDEYGVEIMPNNEPDPVSGDQVVVDSIKSMVGLWTQYYLSALGQGSGGGGGGGASALADLVDVQISSPLTGGQALIYNSTLGKWVNGTVQAGVDMNTVWSELAGSGTEQINISHLTGALADYATQTWVSNNFITVAYFDRLFRAYNGNTLVNHNDTTSTIDNIKAMFGFWTAQYLSALGNSSGQVVSLGLSELLDVQLTTPVTNGQALVYNATSLKWENQTISTVTALANLTDVLLTSVADKQMLLYDGRSTKWINTTMKTINGQSIIGSGDISVGGGASGNYLPLTGGTLTNVNGILTLNGTGDAAYMFIKIRGTTKGAFGWYKNFTWLSNEGTVSRLGLTDDGVPQYWTNSTGTTRYNLLHAGNFRSFVGDYYLPLTGGTLTNSVSGGANATLIVHNTYGSDTWLRTISSLAPNIRTGAEPNIYIGVANSARNGGYIGFKYNGSGSASNFVALGLYGYDNIIVATGNNQVGINNTSPSYTLHVSGSIYATGGITALSDIKQKNVEQYDAHLGFDEVANAPIIKFTWKDPKAEDKGLHVGSIAQYWEKVLPEAVKRDKEGTLSMSYGVVALVAAISTAKKVQEHERRIAELERENKELKERLKIA